MNTSILVPGILVVSTISCLVPKQKAEFETKLMQWVGKPISEFVQVYGKPARVSSMPGGQSRYIFNTRLRTDLSNVNYQSYSDSKTGLAVAPQPAGDTTSTGGRVLVRKETVMMGTNLYCRLIIETTAQGIISTTRYEGNDCW